jgi:hypothetical protein
MAHRAPLSRRETRMPVRMTQETQDVIDGRRQVEAAATVRVPAIESETQTEAAARQTARRALQQALTAFPL